MALATGSFTSSGVGTPLALPPWPLLSNAAAFRVRKMQLWQIVVSKRGVPGGYESIRD